ncbi:hypothetical protein [Actibacterium sp. MT2.3-13A]|uniref:hypothetical protein n=1 Tax=Actibacterium sp. MT2.3-13A TaxID=2828332 RepID=UPI001BAD35FB|nr:hypothetical protein [Actibacterium sp. MT2.3-13A]
MAQVSVEQLAASVEALMEKRMGVGGRGLPAKLRRAGRRLPRHVRRDAGMIAEALHLARSPKLARQIDLARLEVAERRVAAYLRGYDRADRRKGAVLGLLGSLSFNLLAVGALVVAVLVWRGLV